MYKIKASQKNGFFGNLTTKVNIMQNALKTSLVATSTTSNNKKPVAINNFDCTTIDSNNPPSAIYNYCNNNTTYIVPNTLLPFDSMFKVVPYSKNTAMGILAILMLSGVITLTKTSKTVNYVNTKGNSKVMPVFTVAINTGEVITYIDKNKKSTTSVGALLSALMGQAYGSKGKSHNALVSALFAEQCYNGYNVLVKPFKKADINPLVILTKTKPTGTKHSAEVIETYMAVINALLKAYNFLVKA